MANLNIFKFKINKWPRKSFEDNDNTVRFFRIALFFISLSLINMVFSKDNMDVIFYLLIFFYSLGAISVMTKTIREHPNFKDLSLVLSFFLIIAISNTKLEENIFKFELILIIFAYYFISLRIEILISIFLYFMDGVCKFFPYQNLPNFLVKALSLLLSPPKLLGIMIYYVTSYKIINISNEWDFKSIESELANYWRDLTNLPFFKGWPDTTPDFLDHFLKSLNHYIINALNFIGAENIQQILFRMILILVCIALFCISMLASNLIEKAFKQFFTNKMKKYINFNIKFNDLTLHFLIILILILFFLITALSNRGDFIFIFSIPIIWVLVNSFSNYIEELPVIIIQNTDIILAVDCSESMIFFDPDQKVRKDLIKQILLYTRSIEKLDHCFEFELFKLKFHIIENILLRMPKLIKRFLNDLIIKNKSKQSLLKKIRSGVFFWSDRLQPNTCKNNLTYNIKELLSFINNEFPNDDSPFTNIKHALESAIELSKIDPRNEDNIYNLIIFITDGIRDGNEKNFDLSISNFNYKLYNILYLCVNAHPPKSFNNIVVSTNAKLIILKDFNDLYNILVPIMLHYLCKKSEKNK